MSRVVLFAGLLLAATFLAGCVSLDGLASNVTANVTPGFKLPLEGQNLEELYVIHPTLQTKDGFRLAADYSPATGATTGIILLHQLGADKSSWASFTPLLEARNYAVLAVDLRGHGGTTRGGKSAAWSTLTPAEQAAVVNDAQAAADFLGNQNFSTIAVIGASIGANAALQLAARDFRVKAVVALSPGLDYQGVETPGAVQTAKVPLLLVTSTGDAYSLNNTRQLAALNANAEKLEVARSGHGTKLLDDPLLPNKILDWLNSKGTDGG